MAKQYKTSGETRKMFTRIGRVGGNTVKGLVAGGRLFNVLWKNKLIEPEAIKRAADEAGISPEAVDAAFEAAERARDELEDTELGAREETRKRRAA